MVENEEAPERELSFWGHLSDLLRHLRRILLIVVVATVLVMVLPISLDVSSLLSDSPYYETIASAVIRKMQVDFLPPQIELLPISWIAPIEVYFFVSILLALTISSPVIAYELYRFIDPALQPHEKKTISTFIGSFTLLFVLGFVVGYLVVAPMTIRTLLLFAQFLDLTPTYEFSSFFFLITSALLVSGLAFTFPMYLILLVKAGIVKTAQVSKNRKYVYSGIIIVIALLDPDPTLITEIFVGVPIILLTELSLRIAKRYEKPQN